MSNETENNNLNYLIDPTFTNVNRLFVLSFKNEDEDVKTSFKKYCLPSVLIDEKPFFDINIKIKEEAYESNIEMSRNNDYTTGNLLDNEYFSRHYRLIEMDLSKQNELENSDLKQQINVIGRLERERNATEAIKATMFFIIEKKKKPLLIFHKIL